MYKIITDFSNNRSSVTRSFNKSYEIPEGLFNGLDNNGFPKINTWVFEALNSGKELYFGHLKNSFPNFYRILIEECSDLSLIEVKTKDLSLAGNKNGGYRLDYSFAIVSSASQLICFSLPGVFDDMDDRINEVSEETEGLPKVIQELYYSFDRFDKFDLEEDGVSNSLIENIGHYKKMENNLEYKYDSYKESYLSNRVSNEMSIIIQTGCFDYLLIDSERNDQKLYLSIGPGFDNLKELKNPAEHLDAYFSQVLMGTCPRKPNPYNDDGDTYYSLDVEF
ncbi:hypothetical protein [Marinicellulosiphila megalodicopiae]|uniref:hypothetical protein n=1 Tax=Marinicellulosiphila megalodicopiae TaxID=2724896 RepID=UPI003BAFB5FF